MLARRAYLIDHELYLPGAGQKIQSAVEQQCPRRGRLCTNRTGRTHALAYTGRRPLRQWVTGIRLWKSSSSAQGLEKRSQAYALAVSCRSRWRRRANASGWTTSQMDWRPTSESSAVTGAKDHAILIGHKSNWPNLSKRGGRNGWLFGGACLREQNPLIGPMCWSLPTVVQHFSRWQRPSERVRRWSNVLKRARERSAWITMRSDPGRDGIVTSPCACLLTLFWWSCEHRAKCSGKIRRR